MRGYFLILLLLLAVPVTAQEPEAAASDDLWMQETCSSYSIVYGATCMAQLDDHDRRAILHLRKEQTPELADGIGKVEGVE